MTKDIIIYKQGRSCSGRDGGRDGLGLGLPQLNPKRKIVEHKSGKKFFLFIAQSIIGISILYIKAIKIQKL